MKILMHFQFKHFVMLFLIFYGLIFFLEPIKAKEVFWGTIEKINFVVEWSENLFPELKEQSPPAPSLSPPSSPQQPSPPRLIPDNEKPHYIMVNFFEL